MANTLVILNDPSYARGMTETGLTEGTRRSTLEQRADWTQWTDKIIVF